MRHAVAALLLATAVGQAVLDDGGFLPGPRIAFAVLSAFALAAALTAERPLALQAARAPAVLVLWTLGALGALSTLWTVGLAGDALRWGLVTLGYGAIAVSAAVLAGRSRGVGMIAAAVCVLAAVSAIVGLIGAASFAEPFADYTRGSWRPGGTLEYSAALSLLAVSALPAVLCGMCGGSRALSVAATVCGTLGASVLALGDSRAELVFAVLICVAAIAAPMRTVGVSRPVAAGAAGTLALTAIAARLVAGGHVRMDATAQPARRLAELSLVCALPALAWLLGRPLLARARRIGAGVRRGFALTAVGLTVLVAGVATATDMDGGNFWHGRIRTWQAAVTVAEQRPLLGSGADSFLVATVVEQRYSPVRFAHDLPLELTVELGVAGLCLALALYVTVTRTLWLRRHARVAWLLGPAVAAFLAASLVDWPWHLAGSGAVWAAAFGALLNYRSV